MNKSIWALSWIPVAITFNQTVGQIMWVSGRSMQPALNPDTSLGANDLIVVKKWGLRRPKAIQQGDVIAFTSPLNPNRVLIKRVLAVAGQTVDPRPTSEYPTSEVKIPVNHFWVEGDNIHSVDSNSFGPISAGLVIGKATFVLYPFKRWGAVSGSGRDAVVDGAASMRATSDINGTDGDLNDATSNTKGSPTSSISV